ncbi:complex I subunit 4 family protein [Candidatus Protochlamydia phocaeensis]|uniref:complex I subunit 4 family protein n=1 Tax=Candidatus Protochlamydia phocaeensis TaxID=1414722 RepID=UPI0008397078|nr:NADH-quinone oxidoreductase subunit M [Candidatus Protochlamydia phocaeensis]
MPNLLWLFFTPFMTAAVAFALSFIPGKKLKPLAVALSLIPLAILLFGGMNWIGAQVAYPWLPALSVEFHLSVDSLSLLFLYLTAIIIPISLLAMRSEELRSPGVFYGLVLLLQGLLIGFFTARDLVVFTLFWEAMLIPLYFIINFWGGAKRQAAAFKFLIYLLAGSSLMVAGVLALYLTALANGMGTFNLDALARFSHTMPHAAWIGFVFILAFAVKTPLFPFHAWLPDAYYEAPIAGSILLSALLSKAGIYGFLRIGLELFPNLIQAWSPLLLGLAIAGVLYGGLAAWMQSDFKRLIAYSSFSHVNFVLAGLFVWSQAAHGGAILQAINHGISIAGLFLVVGWLEERLQSTAIGPAGGLAKFMPHLCWLTLLFVLSSVALPGTNSFVGEIMILFGLFGQHPWLASILGLTVILSAVYMLRWMQKVYFETPRPSQPSWVDISGREWAIALPLVALIFWIGLYPSPILKQVDPAAEKTVAIAQLEESQ